MTRSFTDEYGLASFSSYFFLHVLRKRTFGDKRHRFLPADVLLVTKPTVSIKALKETQSTDHNPEKSPAGLILSLSTTRFLRGKTMLQAP